MENSKFVYDESKYIPTDENFYNDLLLGSMGSIYRAGKMVRDF